VIQVCSECGTRWNVRDRQRVWCPRCQGTLLAPSNEAPPGDPRWGPAGAAQSGVGHRAAPRLPPGYRWIAVRPGAPPRARGRRPPLGPTPRYAVIPRWGLVDGVAPAGAAKPSQARRGPSVDSVRTTLFAGTVVLGVVVLVHVVRYLLLVLNRNTLLNPLVAAGASWLGTLASVAAMLMMCGCAVVLTSWLVTRRAAAFARRGKVEPRPAWTLWVGCLAPPAAALVAASAFAVAVLLVDGRPSWTRMAIAVAGCLLPVTALVWPLVYVVELAKAEDLYGRWRERIWAWWVSWLVSVVASVFATTTSFAADAQGVGNNAVAVIVAYLLAMLALRITGRVFDAFEQKPIERPAHRWVVVADEPSGTASAASAASAASPVESTHKEPAA
jgi:hypothetical protein